jgi:hypothetical protein
LKDNITKSTLDLSMKETISSASGIGGLGLGFSAIIEGGRTGGFGTLVSGGFNGTSSTQGPMDSKWKGTTQNGSFIQAGLKNSCGSPKKLEAI